jgi:hypothetical protein
MPAVAPGLATDCRCAPHRLGLAQAQPYRHWVVSYRRVSAVDQQPAEIEQLANRRSQRGHGLHHRQPV